MYGRRRPQPIWAVDFVIVLLLVFTVVAVLYPLWFVVIASFSNPNAVAGGEVITAA